MNRVFQLSGIAFVAVVLLTIIGISGGSPEPGESAAKVASFYDDNEARQFIGTFVFAAAVPFLILFGVGLARSLSGEDAIGGWGQVTIAGAILAGGAILATAAIHFALLDAATDKDPSLDALVALNTLDGSTWAAFNAGFGVLMIGAAGLLLSIGVMRWLGWIALVLGIALFVPYADFFALLGTLLWIVVTSVALARAKPEAALGAVPGTA